MPGTRLYLEGKSYENKQWRRIEPPQAQYMWMDGPLYPCRPLPLLTVLSYEYATLCHCVLNAQRPKITKVDLCRIVVSLEFTYYYMYVRM